MVPASGRMGMGTPGHGVPDTGAWAKQGRKPVYQGLPEEGSLDERSEGGAEWGWGCGERRVRMLEFGDKGGPAAASWGIFTAG